ncbi:hypothetical protein [Micromonospora sp. NPDC049240]|uniref:hypothetical protein n=1 Tax=Micromonospora sp. NPDC049240 TaxID=3155151 RepID=UPI0033FF637B
MKDGSDATPKWLERDEPVRQALHSWPAGAGGGTVEVLPQDRPMRGYTNAYLFIVKQERPAGPGRTDDRKLLVKVHVPGGTGRPEPSRHAQARADAPGFAKRHMVEEHYGWHPVGDGRHLSFQDVANGGDRVVTIDEITDDGDLVRVFRKVLAGLLTGWNRPPKLGRPSTAASTAREYLHREVTTTASLSAIRSALHELGLRDAEQDWVRIDGATLPNPLRLAEGGGPFGDTRIHYVRGFAHGDLHGGNLLIPVTTEGVLDPGRFTVIDFESYESGAPVTRDPVALLVSIALRWVAPPPGPDETSPRGLPTDQADALRDHLIRPDQDAPTRLLPALAQLVRLTHDAGMEYTKPGNWRSEWRRQYRLSLIARALTATTFDSLGREGRWWCLRLAAHAAEAYRREYHSGLTPPTAAAAQDAPLPTPIDPSWRTNTPTYDMPPARWHGPGTPGRHRIETGHPRNAAPTGIDPDQAERPAHRNIGRPLADDLTNGVRHPRARRSAGGVGRRRLTVAVLAALGGSLVVQLAPGSTSDRDVRPPVTVPPSSRETQPSRGGPRDPVPSEPVDPGTKLDQIADRTAGLSETPSRGRYAFTCLRVWSPEDLALGSDDLMRYQEEWLWWTGERSGRRTVLAVDDGRRSRPRVSRYDRGELTDVPPDPAEDLTELRGQVEALLRKKPPALRNAAGTLELVAWIYQFRPLTAPQRATLLRLLAGTDGIVHRGRFADRADRYGYAISATNAAGQQETLLFDEDTGRLLGHIKTSADDHLLAYYLFLTSARTDSIGDPPCVDLTTVNSDG